MGVEKNLIDAKLNKSGSLDLYRPPALRNNYADSSISKKNVYHTTEPYETTSSSCKAMTAAAVSMTNSMTTMPPAVNSFITTTTTTTTSVSCNNSPIHKKETSNTTTSISKPAVSSVTTTPDITTSTHQQNSLCPLQQQVQQQTHPLELQEQHKQPQRTQPQQQARRERRPDRAVYIPRARRSQTTPPTTATTQIQQTPQPPPPPPPSSSLSGQTPLAPLTASTSSSVQVLGAPTTTTTPPTATNYYTASKSLSQQLANTLDDTTAASVNQRPSSKADEVGKTHAANNKSSNISITKLKKDKTPLSKEAREQRREQRVLKKSNNNSKNNNIISPQTTDDSTVNNKLINSDEIISASSQNQNLLVNAQQPQQQSCKSVLVNKTSEENSIEFIKKEKEFNNEYFYRQIEKDNVNINDHENNTSVDVDIIICDKEQKEESESKQQQQQQQDISNNFELNSNVNNINSKSCVITNLLNLENTNCFENINDICAKNEFQTQLHLEPIDTVTANLSNTNTNTNTNTYNINNSSNTINTMPKPSHKTNNKSQQKISSATDMANTATTQTNNKLTNLRIEDVVASSPQPTKCDIEEQELQRASKEINRSNRRIIKQTFNSDVLQIPDHIEKDSNDLKTKTSSTTVGTKKTTNNSGQQKNCNVIDSNTEEEEEEDDWESMFDDNGECLNPKIMQELTASVGKCKIELPKMDYSAFLTKQSILNDEEFPHVLEVSNFPVEFKNQDLLMVFSQYKESGFDIKWVDDTHALAVFSSSRIAAEVLTMGHPFVVLKPLAEATVESRLKAKKCSASLQPYRPRPETCAALARRLVTGALGVRLKTAAAERENEKRVLREAKERKLLAAKQREETWDS